jgi:hypothetical protein
VKAIDLIFRVKDGLRHVQSVETVGPANTPRFSFSALNVAEARFAGLVIYNKDGKALLELPGTELNWRYEGDNLGKVDRNDRIPAQRPHPTFGTGPLREGSSRWIYLWVRIPSVLLAMEQTWAGEESLRGDYALVFIGMKIQEGCAVIDRIGIAAGIENPLTGIDWLNQTTREIELEEPIIFASTGKHPQSEIGVYFTTRGAAERLLGVRSDFLDFNEDDPKSNHRSAPLIAFWKRPADGLPLRLVLQRKVRCSPGSRDVFLQGEHDAVLEQRQAPGSLVDGMPVWRLGIAGFPASTPSEAAQRRGEASRRGWEALMRTWKGRPETETTLLFDLQADQPAEAWLHEYDMIVTAKGGANHQHEIELRERCPEWEGLNCTLSFPGLQTWNSRAVTAQAKVAVTAPAEVKEVAASAADDRCSAVIVISRLKCGEQHVRAGSLDLTFDGELPASHTARTTLGFIRRTMKAPALTGAGNHKLTLLELTDFEIGADDLPLRLPVKDIAPGGTDSDERRMARREGVDPPLVLNLNTSPVSGTAVLGATEMRPLDGGAFLRFGLLDERPAQPPKLDRTNLLLLDRQPFFAGMVRLPHLLDFDREGGNEIAYWSNEDVFAGWQMRVSAGGFDIVFPPQGLGEAMEKSRAGEGYAEDIATNRRVDFLFTPAAVASLKTGDLPRRYGSAPWNLRLLLNELRETRLTGLPLEKLRLELLYGLSLNVENLPWLRLAEVFSRLGMPRTELAKKAPAEFSQPRTGVLPEYEATAQSWKQQLVLIRSRLAVYEVFDDRQPDFTEKGEPAGLLLTGRRGAPGLSAELRRTAHLANPLAGRPPLEAGIPAHEDGLSGSFAWAFESKLVYDALWRNSEDPACRQPVPFVEALLSRIYLSALGGWGEFRVSFDEGRTVIAGRVEMQRISELRVERVGRLGVFWNRASLVTVFRRTTLPSTQFAAQQDSHTGRAILRKVEEYVELLEKKRRFPDEPGSEFSALLPGCVTGCSCEERIPVDSRWGRDIYKDDGTPFGWLVPLRVAGAAPHIYGPANLLLHFHADARGPGNDTAGRIENLTEVSFWSDVTPGAGADTNAWPVVPGVDSGTFGHLGSEPESLEWGAPAVAGDSARFTWRIAGLTRKANLAGHLAPAGGPEEAAPQIGSILRSVTMARAIATAAEADAPTLDQFHAQIENALAVAEQVVTVPPGTTPLKQEIWGNLPSLLDPNPSQLVKHGPLKKAREVLTELKRRRDSSSAAVKGLEGKLCGRLRGNVEWGLKQGEGVIMSLAERLAAMASSPLTTARSELEKGNTDIGQWLDEAADGLQYAWQSTLASAQGTAASARDALNDAELLLGRVKAKLDQLEAEVGNWPGPVAAHWGQFESCARTLLLTAGKAADRITSASWFRGLRVKFRPEPLLASLQRLLDRATLQLETDIADLQKKAKADILESGKALEAMRKPLQDAAVLIGEVAAEVNDGLDHLYDELQRGIDDVRNAANSSAAEALTKLEKLQTLIKKELPDRLRQALENESAGLAAAAEKRCELFLGNAKDMLNSLLNEAGQFIDDLKARLPDLAALEGDVMKTAQWLAAQREAISGLVRGLPDDARAVLDAGRAVLQTPGRALNLFRAYGGVPAVPMMDFREITGIGELDKELKHLGSRLRSVGYVFDSVAEKVGMTSVKATVDRMRDDADNLIEEVRLKGAAMEMKVNEIKDRILTDVKKLEGDALSSLLPDFGGLKLEKLLGGITVTEDFANAVREKVKFKHGFDRQTLTGFVDAEVDCLPLHKDGTIFALGPIAFSMRRPVLSAQVRLEMQPGQPVRRTSRGKITADWEMALGERPLITYQGSSLVCDNGRVRMDLDPSRLVMDGLLKSLSDMMSGLQTGDDVFNAGVIVGLPSRILGYCRLNLEVPPIQGGTFAVTNIILGAYLEAGLELSAGQFLVRAGMNVSSRESPFAIIVFILGGCGWFKATADYRVPLRDGKPVLLVTIDGAIGVCAGLGINLGFLRGSIFASLALEVSCTIGGGATQYSLSAILTFCGRVSVLGIIDVNLLLVLGIRYSTGGQLTGYGFVSISIRICWFFKIKIRRSFTYSFGKSQGSGADSRRMANRPRPMPSSLAPGAASMVAKPLTPDIRRERVRAAAAMMA